MEARRSIPAEPVPGLVHVPADATAALSWGAMSWLGDMLNAR